MKKILILALVAIVAGAAFAETDPVFSGSFSTYWAYSFAGETLSDDNSLGMSVALNATIDDFNTVSVSVGLADAMYWDDIYDDDKFYDADLGGTAGDNGAGVGTQTDSEFGNRGDYLRMNGFTLSTDLTGALGVDAPVSVTTKMGDFGFGTVNVANVAPLSTDVVGGSGADGGVGIALSIGVMDMVTLGTVVYPVNAFEDKKGETGVTLQASGIAGMIDVAAYFIASEWNYAGDVNNIDGDPVDDEGMNMGFSVKAMPVDGLTVGAGFAYDMSGTNADGDKGIAAAQLDLAVSMIENLTAGLSFGAGDFSDLMPTSSIKASLSYALMDNVSVYGAIGMGLDFNNFEARDLDYDAGLTTSLAALAIQVGFSNNLDYKAPEDDFDDVLFVKFSTSF
ncbi:MAG: hypothetical protein P1P77_08530 [Spirochaetaceae bacterium]|nr:hypothetical protein [Spirochaetaceae bacterium]